jgi:hypothetical protein
MVSHHFRFARAVPATLALALSVTAFGCSPDSGPEISRGAAPITAGALTVQAESASDLVGVTNHGNGISYVDHGDSVKYASVNFGAAWTYGKFVARIASPFGGNRVEVRRDSPDGPLVADLVTTATGSFSDFAEQSAPIMGPVSGVHDLYVRFVGATNRAACQICWDQNTSTCPAADNGCGYGIGNFDWFALDERPSVIVSRNESLDVIVGLPVSSLLGPKLGGKLLRHVGPLTPAAMPLTKSGNVLVLAAPNTVEELETVKAFVNAGGSVLIVGDNNFGNLAPAAPSYASAFGITMVPGNVGPCNTSPSGYQAAAEVVSAALGAPVGTPIAVSAASTLVGGTPVVQLSGTGQTILAITTYGAGRVAVSSDVNLLQNTGPTGTPGPTNAEGCRTGVGNQPLLNGLYAWLARQD